MPDFPPLYTIGHSNHPESHLIGLLGQHGIQTLVDVRSQPFSRYTPQFNRESLALNLPAAGIRYWFLGDQLGGRPVGDDYYDAAGHVLYSRVAQADFFRDGIAQVLQLLPAVRLALMCSEENPLVCHRHRLVARVLRDRGVPIQHIRQNGELESYQQVEPPQQQRLLFDELEEETWRSLRSVLPSPALGTSSND